MGFTQVISPRNKWCYEATLSRPKVTRYQVIRGPTNSTYRGSLNPSETHVFSAMYSRPHFTPFESRSEKGPISAS